MDIELRKKALSNLAKTAGDVAENALGKELRKISETLESESQYDVLEEQLALLECIAHRQSEEAIATIISFLERLKTIELMHQEVLGYPVERIREINTSSRLVVKSLEVLENIRYHQPSTVLDIFFEYSVNEDEKISKQACHAIEELAEYNIDIFYGDGKGWKGLGWQPQEKVLDKISSLNDEQRVLFHNAIVVSCEKILSPTVSGTSSTYKTLTWRTGAIPAEGGIKEVRERALSELKKLYSVATDISERKSVLNAMVSATRTPHMGNYGDDVLAMIVNDTKSVISFIKDVAISDDLQMMQKIEHDAYWVFYHKGKLNDYIRETALEIRDELYGHREYQIFRILIGYESIFHDWEKNGKEREDFDYEREYRDTEALKLAESIDDESYAEWKDRIIRYASIKSNDMATFPYFGKFLEYYGKKSPVLALRLLTESSDSLNGFIIPIMCGVVQTDQAKEVYMLIDRLCENNNYLYVLARFFEYSPELNDELLSKILDKAIANNDTSTLNQIMSSVAAKYTKGHEYLIEQFFIPSLKELTARKNSDWIFGFWFRKNQLEMLNNMSEEMRATILDNLLWLKNIDHQAEEILSAIAEISPNLVTEYFCTRLSKEKSKEIYDYEAIPFDFYKLSEPLSKYPAEVVGAVRQTYDGNYGMFQFRGARLLKNIFTDFSKEFQGKLLEMASTGSEDDMLFVLAILRNYEGNPFIHDVCREIVKILPGDSKLLNEVSVILQSTGVVSGEYGFIEAYKRKIEEIQPWLEDENEQVKNFAKSYISELEQDIEYEKKRADEGIALRKYQYGDDPKQN